MHQTRSGFNEGNMLRSAAASSRTSRMAVTTKLALLAIICYFLACVTASDTNGEHGYEHGGEHAGQQDDFDIYGIDDIINPFSNYSFSHVEPLLLLDDFSSKDHNSLGSWHGVSDKLPVRYRHNHLVISPKDSDGKYHIQLGEPACYDLTPYKQAYLHVVFHGSTAFTISLEQNNEHCSEDFNPYPETWDSVEAGNYIDPGGEGDIYVPLWHFNVDFTRASSVSFHGFFTHKKTYLARVEIVEQSFPTFIVPDKVPTAKVILRCNRPNSFAFGIDDGEPGLAQEVMDILYEEGVKVTFFTVGNGLDDPKEPFGEVYRDALKKGHQVSLHSYTHPALEGLESIEAIDEELNKNIDALDRVLNTKTHFFRPPYGTLGARTLERLYALLGPYAKAIVWSVDVEDWLWAKKKPSRQFAAFKRDVDKGGNIVVMHYLHKSTVRVLRKGIRLIKKRGLDIMRVDQCLGEYGAPAYVKGWNDTFNDLDEVDVDDVDLLDGEDVHVDQDRSRLDETDMEEDEDEEVEEEENNPHDLWQEDTAEHRETSHEETHT